MHYRLLADTVLVLHFAFVAFALLGGLLVLRQPRIAWLHLPVLAWGLAVQWADWICPLTPLENHFRMLGGEAGYEGGFIEHYLMQLLYPDNLTLELRYMLGAVLLIINAVVYARLIFRKRA
jgi:hypothetical protein